MDDCMSFPGLLVRVKRYKRCIIYYKDLEWNDCSMELEGDMSELIQHEYDHLDGILATLRAVDKRALASVRTHSGHAYTAAADIHDSCGYTRPPQRYMTAADIHGRCGYTDIFGHTGGMIPDD